MTYVETLEFNAMADTGDIVGIRLTLSNGEVKCHGITNQIWLPSVNLSDGKIKEIRTFGPQQAF